MRTAACITVLFAGFLTAAAIASDLPSDKRDFQVFVEREVTLGMSLKTAEDRLKSFGLECKPVTSGWTNNVHDTTAFVFCSRGSGGLVSRRWQVALLPRDGKVVEMRANVGLVGP